VEVIECATAADWESWLAEYHAAREGVWLKIAKKGSARRSVTPAEATEVASWSRINAERAAALIAAGRMRASGLAQVEAAKADGRWEAAYEPQRTASVPADLAAALACDEPARVFFESLGRTDRYAVILRLSKSPSAARREHQLRQIIALLRAGQRVS